MCQLCLCVHGLQAPYSGVSQCPNMVLYFERSVQELKVLSLRVYSNVEKKTRSAYSKDAIYDVGGETRRRRTWREAQKSCGLGAKVCQFVDVQGSVV